MSPFLYQLAKKFLFQLQPETAHYFSLSALRMANRLCMLPLVMGRPVEDPVEVMGLRFPNRVGLAAGMDKEANSIDALGALGFGFIEVGTLTPRSQPGNPKPRVHRCIPEEAIINYMGINNPGIDKGMSNLCDSRKFKGIIGVNIGKNSSTPNEEANADYLNCLRTAWNYADYIAINFSCPNVKNLCDLMQIGPAAELLSVLKAEQNRLHGDSGRYVPLAMKISPDMNETQVKELSKVFVDGQLDGLICTNTTTTREGVENHPAAKHSGGLSGKPLYNKANEVLEAFAQELKGQVPIIGVGGITRPEDAVAKIKAGASLVQLYTGFIYHGPPLIKGCAQAVKDYFSQNPNA